MKMVMLHIPIGLDKSIMTSIHYNVIRSIFIAHKNLYTLCIISLQTSGNHWSFYCFHSLAFSRMEYS